jgi:hypothetical protein
MRPPFPEVIDSSLIAAFRSCPQKAFLEFFEHWKLRDPSVHLHAGAAFARGLEVARTAFYTEGRSPTDSVALGLRALIEAYGEFECPADSAKSLERMAGALEFYFERYPLGQDQAIPMSLPGGKRGIEFSFLEPIEILHPTTGNPILYSGRFDMIVNYQNLALGEDDKTASQLGASWPRQWDLRSQFTAYTWGAKQAGIKLDGFLVRGVSILKTKYDTLETITYRPEWQIRRWYEQMLRDVRRMIASWESGIWDFNLDHACAEYGGCPFRGVCQLVKPEHLLRQQFERRIWDPVRRVETLVEDAS